MSAKEYAQYVFDLMQKTGYPYMSPELGDEIPDCPSQIQVWDAEMSMIRVISFADDAAGVEEALRYSWDTINTVEHAEWYWPEAWWWADEYHHEKIEGWDEEAPTSE